MEVNCQCHVPVAIFPRVRVPGIHGLGFRVTLNVFEKGETACPCRELNQKEMAGQGYEAVEEVLAMKML
jgi:hypothetical protein